MKPGLIFVICGFCSYLLGAIPFGFLVARARGIDIRTKGSGNIGATNVWRTLGKGSGILTFILDVLKGFIPAFVFPRLAGGSIDPGLIPILSVACAALAIAGHNWPVFLAFKGGKGVATSAGALLGIAPLAVLCGLLVWAVVFRVSRYVSVASMVAALSAAGAAWVLWDMQDGQPILVPIALSLLCAVVIWRHKTNIQRLFAGTENRFDFKKKSGLS